MKKYFSVFLQVCFIILCASAIAFLSIKAEEIDQAHNIIKDLKNPNQYAYNTKDYSISSQRFTTVLHINKMVTPFVCKRVVKARIPFPHLFYSNNKVINVNSDHACDDVKFLSIQFAKKHSFAHRLECFSDDQCETECIYGFCAKEQEEI